MSSTDAPASAFGNLALTGDDEGDMPVTTRAAYRRQSTAVSASFATPTSSFASTRNVLATSSTPRTRRSGTATAPSSTHPSRQSRANVSDDSDDDSSDDDPAPNFERAKASTILQIMAVFDPTRHYSPREFMIQSSSSTATEASRHTRKLAATLSGLIRSQSDLNGLIQAAEFPTGFWARQLASNMESRAAIICQNLESNLRDPSTGSGVVETIASLRSLFAEIDAIRETYLRRMGGTERRRFASILVTALQWVVRNNDDLYAHVPLPAYAGEGLQSERRLLSSFLSANGHPQQFLEILRRFNGNLRHETGRLEYIYSTLHGVITSTTAASSEAAAHLNSVLHGLHSLLTGVYLAEHHDSQC